MTDARPILVCVPITAPTSPVAGSTIVSCSRCKTRVWLSPSSTPVMVSVVILCAQCALDTLVKGFEDGDPIRFGGFLPGQLGEIDAELKKGKQ